MNLAERKARNDALNEAADIASLFTLKKDARIHPDIAFEEMNESAKIAAHTTAQQIAEAIRGRATRREQQ